MYIMTPVLKTSRRLYRPVHFSETSCITPNFALFLYERAVLFKFSSQSSLNYELCKIQSNERPNNIDIYQSFTSCIDWKIDAKRINMINMSSLFLLKLQFIKNIIKENIHFHKNFEKFRTYGFLYDKYFLNLG